MTVLSAHALEIWSKCRRRFKLQYVHRQIWPALRPANNPAVQLGESFHRQVHRYLLGIPVQVTDDLSSLWEAFLASPYASLAGQAGALAKPTVGCSVYVEQVLRFSVATPQGTSAHLDRDPSSFLPVGAGGPDGLGRQGPAGGRAAQFLVRFDLVIRQRQGGDETWIIVDWKTGHLNREGLEDRWQTKLYRLALALAGNALDHVHLDQRQAFDCMSLGAAVLSQHPSEGEDRQQGPDQTADSQDEASRHGFWRERFGGEAKQEGVGDPGGRGILPPVPGPTEAKPAKGSSRYPVAPERIKLVYWQVGACQGVTLPYDAKRFERDYAELLATAKSIAEQGAGDPGPLQDHRPCQGCPYFSYCHTAPAPPAPGTSLILPQFID